MRCSNTRALSPAVTSGARHFATGVWICARWACSLGRVRGSHNRRAIGIIESSVHGRDSLGFLMDAMAPPGNFLLLHLAPTETESPSLIAAIFRWIIGKAFTILCSTTCGA